MLQYASNWETESGPGDERQAFWLGRFRRRWRATGAGMEAREGEALARQQCATGCHGAGEGAVRVRVVGLRAAGTATAGVCSCEIDVS